MCPLLVVPLTQHFLSFISHYKEGMPVPCLLFQRNERTNKRLGEMHETPTELRFKKGREESYQAGRGREGRGWGCCRPPHLCTLGVGLPCPPVLWKRRDKQGASVWLLRLKKISQKRLIRFPDRFSTCVTLQKSFFSYNYFAFSLECIYKSVKLTNAGLA